MTIPRHLICAYVDIVPPSICRRAYPQRITPNMLCAGVRNQRIDSCQVSEGRGPGRGTPKSLHPIPKPTVVPPWANSRHRPAPICCFPLGTRDPKFTSRVVGPPKNTHTPPPQKSKTAPPPKIHNSALHGHPTSNFPANPASTSP